MYLHVGDKSLLMVNLLDDRTLVFSDKKSIQVALKLVSDSDYFSLLQNNAAQTIRDMFDNSAAIDEWVEAYKTIVSH